MPSLVFAITFVVPMFLGITMPSLSTIAIVSSSTLQVISTFLCGLTVVSILVPSDEIEIEISSVIEIT